MISKHQSRITLWLFLSYPRLQAVLAAALCLISAALGSHVGALGQKMADETGKRHATQGSAIHADSTAPAAIHSSSISPASASVTALEIHSSAALTPVSPQPFYAGQGSSREVAASPGDVETQVKTVKPVSSTSGMRRPEPRVLVPMIFREVSPAAGLSGAQVATIDQMRNQFNQKVGTPSSPSDPQYRARWVNAQVEMDDQLRSYLGWEKFNQYQLRAAQSLR